MISGQKTKIEKLIFIVGPHRGGTTMLREILGKHPDVAVTPELRFFDSMIAIRKREMKLDKDFIKRSLRKIKISGDPRWQKIDLKKLEKKLQGASGFRDYFLKLAQATASRNNFKILIEKTPANVFFLKLIKKLFPQSKIIFIIRDGREVCASACKRWQLDGYKYLMIVSRWNLTVREYFRKVKKMEHFFIKYEDVITQPHQKLKKLFNYLDLKYNKSYIQNIGSFSSFAPFSDRGTVYMSRHCRNFFNRKQRQQIEYFMRRYLKKFGYEIEFKRYKVSPKVKIFFWFYHLKNKLFFWLKEKGQFGLYLKIKRIKKFFGK